MSVKISLTRFGAIPGAAVIVMAGAGPAIGHVTIDSTTNEAGAYTLLTVSVPHGCEDSPTTRIAVQLPDPILDVTPTRHPFYDVEKIMTELDEPITDSEGNTVTERVSQVVYTTDQPLPADQRDAFELSLQLPDTPGETLAFPTIQTCVRGETAWIQVPADGQREDELEAPAPLVEVVAAADALPPAVEETHNPDEAFDAAESDAGATTNAATAEPDDDSDSTLGLIGLVAGLLGLAAGATALVQVRRRP